MPQLLAAISSAGAGRGFVEGYPATSCGDQLRFRRSWVYGGISRKFLRRSAPLPGLEVALLEDLVDQSVVECLVSIEQQIAVCVLSNLLRAVSRMAGQDRIHQRSAAFHLG